MLLFVLFVCSGLLLTTSTPAPADLTGYCSMSGPDNTNAEAIALFSQDLFDDFMESKRCKKGEDCIKIKGKGSTKELRNKRFSACKSLLENAKNLINLGPDYYETAAILLDTLAQRCDGLGPKTEPAGLGDWLKGRASDEQSSTEQLTCGLELLMDALLNYEAPVAP